MAPGRRYGSSRPLPSVASAPPTTRRLQDRSSKVPAHNSLTVNEHGPSRVSRQQSLHSASLSQSRYAPYNTIGAAGTTAILPSPHGHLGPADEGLEVRDEVTMALEMKNNGVVGCSHFSVVKETLYLHEDTRITGLEIVESLLLQIQPTTVIVPSRAPEHFIENLERLSQESSDGSSAYAGLGAFRLRCGVSSDFDVESGKECLASLGSPHLVANGTMFATATECGDMEVVDGQCQAVHRRNDLMRLGTHINLESPIALACANALVGFLKQKASSGTYYSHPFRPRSVQMISYKDCMFVTADTMLALQIFRPDGRQHTQHRGTGKDTNDSKDSQSVFGLFNSLAVTSQGRSRLREAFLRPSIDLSVLAERHDLVSILLDRENEVSVASMKAVLKRVKNVQPLLFRVRKGVLTPGGRGSVNQGTWLNLLNFSNNSVEFLQLAKDVFRGRSKTALEEFSETQCDALYAAGIKIKQTIDFSESRLADRTIVSTGVSHDLDNCRDVYSSLQDRLSSICDGYRQRLPEHLRSTIVGSIYHPQVSYLTIATTDPRVEGYQNSDISSSFDLWEEAFEEDGLLYFKTSEMESLDEEFGDLAGRIIELEVDILHDLGMDLLKDEDTFVAASEAVAELDFLMALASGARKFDLTRPRMTPASVIHIREGRHILQERAVGTFVPNDCSLVAGEATLTDPDDIQLIEAQEEPSALVLTGPNHSGKSVYLKQVAITVYMAHIGSFVPAAESTIGITDRILTRLTTRETVSQDESAFGVDLRQAAFSINFATPRSLVLIDEFGKGTTPTDGAALFEALLNHFVGVGAECTPRVLAATHLHELFENGFLLQNPRLRLAHMNVTVDPEASQAEDKVKFRYELRMGRSAESFGCHCAAMNGVDRVIVERANRVSESLAQGALLEKICLKMAPEEAARLQDDEEKARTFLQQLEDEEYCRKRWGSPRDMLEHLLCNRRDQ